MFSSPLESRKYWLVKKIEALASDPHRLKQGLFDALAVHELSERHLQFGTVKV